jgi:uncharacterized membrane protein
MTRTPSSTRDISNERSGSTTMAGIGFRLQALAKKDSYLTVSTAYLASAVIAVGPWLVSVTALMVLEQGVAGYLSGADQSFLFATIVAVFVASLLAASGPQMLIVRYLADRFYLNDLASIAPTCNGVLFLILPFMLIALPFLLLAPFDLRYRMLVTTLFVTLTMLWVIMVFLSAAREYLRILLIFVVCYALGVVASLVLGRLYGLMGVLAGFTLGQMICLAALIMSIYLEFAPAQGLSFAYQRSLRHYWDLLVIGTFYTLAIWADSIIFWASPSASVIHGFYHLFPPYDTAKFVMALATIPTTVLFIVHVETNFHRYFQHFYQSLQTRGTLGDLIRAREGMQEVVRKGTWLLVKVQASIALFLYLIAQDLATFMKFAPQWIPLLRVEVLASVGQGLIFVLLLLLLYIDRRRAALIIVSIFLMLNSVLTTLSLYLGHDWYGLGYLGATIMVSLIAWFVLKSRLKYLEYLTFMEQPVG